MENKCDFCQKTTVKIEQFSPDGGYYYFCNRRHYEAFQNRNKKEGKIYRALLPVWIKDGKFIYPLKTYNQ